MLYRTLYNGVEMPILGYGVFRLDEKKCEKCVEEALAAGYRMIDTAAAYRNEASVGRAIKNSKVPREDIFVVTKLRRNVSESVTRKEIEDSLERLQLDYIDLYLIHQPYGDISGAWRAITDYYQKGKIRAIGVSNFREVLLMDLTVNSGVMPMVNQIEINPLIQKKDMVSYLLKNEIIPMAWGPLSQGGKNGMYENPVLCTLAEKYGKSVAQIALRWHIQRKTVVIPRSSNEKRMRENIEIFDFNLTEEEMQEIAAIDLGAQPDIHDDPEFVKILCEGWK